MQVVCLDLEGVLIPEIWINVAERTGIEALRRTTRDEPDYDVLMKYRLKILEENGLTIDLIQDVIGGLGPLPGAREFLDQLREEFQVVILSDTFYQFSDPFMKQLGRPTIFCHKLVIEDGMIRDYKLRMKDHKREAVNHFKQLCFTVFAAGDSYNDTTMLGAADRAFLFRAPQNVIDEFPQFPAETDYDQLLERFRQAGRDLG